MANFTIGAIELKQRRQSEFSEYINIVSGRSIVSGADWGKDRVEFGLSGDGMIRVFWTPKGLEVNFISTTNTDEIPPLIIKMGDLDQRVPAKKLEKRLFALRQLYSLVRLFDTNRLDEIDKVKNLNFDLEDLIPEDEHLYIDCLAPGSWYLTVWSKIQSSYSSLLKTVALIYERGRETLLSKLEAEAQLKNLEVEEREFDLFSKKLDYTLGLSKKLKSPEAKKVLEEKVINSLEDFLLQKRSSNDVIKASKNLLE